MRRHINVFFISLYSSYYVFSNLKCWASFSSYHFMKAKKTFICRRTIWLYQWLSVMCLQHHLFLVYKYSLTILIKLPVLNTSLEYLYLDSVDTSSWYAVSSSSSSTSSLDSSINSQFLSSWLNSLFLPKFYFTNIVFHYPPCSSPFSYMHSPPSPFLILKYLHTYTLAHKQACLLLGSL